MIDLLRPDLDLPGGEIKVFRGQYSAVIQSGLVAPWADTNQVPTTIA